MADEEPKQAEEKAEEKTDKKGKTEDAKGGGMMQWIIMAVILIIMMTVGFFIGNMMGSPPSTAQAQSQQEEEKKADDENAEETLFAEEPAETGWFYHLKDVATTLKDPGATRYVRAVLTLEMVPESDEAKTRKYLDEKKQPIILDILNIYFAGLTVEDINSDKDLRRIQYELLNLLNENLSPNSKPLIKRILIQEFGIQ
jgi:flagellar basal body-associated protein FliL